MVLTASVGRTAQVGSKGLCGMPGCLLSLVQAHKCVNTHSCSLLVLPVPAPVQSFEALNQRAVAVVVDPVQSVKGKVVIDAFRLISPQVCWERGRPGRGQQTRHGWQLNLCGDGMHPRPQSGALTGWLAGWLLSVFARLAH